MYEIYEKSKKTWTFWGGCDIMNQVKGGDKRCRMLLICFVEQVDALKA